MQNRLPAAYLLLPLLHWNFFSLYLSLSLSLSSAPHPTVTSFASPVLCAQVAFRNSTIAKDLKHNEETTRLQKNKQTNKQRGCQDCNEHDPRKYREAEGEKKTRVADNYRILETTTTAKKKQEEECVQNPAAPFIN